MTERDVLAAMSRLVDGQPIRVLTKSGKTFDGIFNGEHSDPEDALYFDSVQDDRLLRAEWDKIESLDFRSARAVASNIVVPEGHPLAPRSDRKKPYTVRNR